MSEYVSVPINNMHISAEKSDFQSFSFNESPRKDDSKDVISDIKETRPVESPSPNVSSKGWVGKSLSTYGFSWMMDEEEDEDSDKSLLEELDIVPGKVFSRFRSVLVPFRLSEEREELRLAPDFWGPLFVVLLYALVSVLGQFKVVSWIITMWLFGSFFIYVIARSLGGDVGYSQSLGVIGYSLLPLVITALVLPLCSSYMWLTLLVEMLGIFWATWAAGSLLCVQELRQKRPLLLYPVFLLYVYFFSLYSGV